MNQLSSIRLLRWCCNFLFPVLLIPTSCSFSLTISLPLQIPEFNPLMSRISIRCKLYYGTRNLWLAHEPNSLSLSSCLIVSTFHQTIQIFLPNPQFVPISLVSPSNPPSAALNESDWSLNRSTPAIHKSPHSAATTIHLYSHENKTLLFAIVGWQRRAW